MNNIITSKENKIYKLAKSLDRKRTRYKEKLFLVEGIKLIREAIQSKVTIKYIIVNESFEISTDIFGERNITTISDSLFDSISTMEKSEGIIGICEFLEIKPRESDRVLILEGINDPGNLGTLIRSSEAFGFDNILLIEGTCDIYNPKVIRATMGSIFRQQIQYGRLSVMDNIRKAGYKVVATSLEENSKEIFDVDRVGKIAIVIGNEANGISEEIKKYVDEFAIIPMQGKVESLNAAMAGTVSMFYFSR